MLLAEERRRKRTTVVRVEEMHRELVSRNARQVMFAAMVDVARAQRSTRRRLNATELAR